MNKLAKLREALKTKMAERAALLEKDALTAEELAQVKALRAEIADIAAEIEERVAAERDAAAASEPANAELPADQQTQTRRSVPAQVKEKLTGLQKAALMSMSIAKSKMDQVATGEYKAPLDILTDNGFEQLSNEVREFRARREELERTLNVSTGSQGGILVPENMSQEIIDLLRPVNAFLQGNPRRVDLPNGVFSQPAAAVGSEAHYRAEGARILTTEPKFRGIQMSVKFLGAIVPMTRQFIQFSIAGARAWVENDLRSAMSDALDTAGFFGTGTQGEPLGVFNSINTVITVPITGGATPTLAQVDDFVRNATMAYYGRNITNSSRWYWVMNPRTRLYLASKRVGNNDGDYAYPTLQGANPSLGGIPILETTKVPVNLGGGTNETMIALVNFDDVMFGQQEGLMMATSDQATIMHNGEWVSAFQNDLVFLRATMAHDVATRRDEVAVVATGVLWGSA